MATLRRRYKNPTPARRCPLLVPMPGSPLPMKCGDRVYKAGICRDHYADKRHGQESRRGTEAVNIQRRERNGTPLPKDLSRATVAEKWKRPEEARAVLSDERRKRQGVSQETQDALMERAARKRARKAGIDYESLSRRKQLRWRAAA